jgi:hypothetical protein
MYPSSLAPPPAAAVAADVSPAMPTSHLVSIAFKVLPAMVLDKEDKLRGVRKVFYTLKRNGVEIPYETKDDVRYLSSVSLKDIPLGILQSFRHKHAITYLYTYKFYYTPISEHIYLLIN